MRLDTIIDLIDLNESIDSDGFTDIAVEKRKSVFAKKESVRSSEYYSATQSGFMREKVMFTVLTLEYKYQTFVEYQNKRYTIIRTYEKGKYIELICQAYQESP
jgi:SPP1 family predicted phage head-tail adaptor